MFYDQIIDQGFSGTAPQFAAHVVNIKAALQRVDAASNTRRTSNKQPLHQYIGSVGLGGTNGAPIVYLTWLNPIEVPASAIMPDTFAESSIKNLIATATVLHDGVARTHNVSLSALAALAW